MARKTPEQRLAMGSVRAIAAREEYSRPSDHRKGILRTSQSVGRVCLRTTKRKKDVDLRSNMKVLTHDLDKLLKTKIVDETIQRKARLFRIGSAFIGKQHLQRTPKELRREYQIETCKQIGELLAKLGDRSQRLQHAVYLGEVCELTTIGLINSQRSPDFMALAAPPHHDFPVSKTPTIYSYDALFVHTDQAPQALQIKRACQAYCDKPEKSNSKNGVKYYHSDIAIISGHCDLGISWKNRELGIYDLTVPSLLVAMEQSPGAYSPNQLVMETTDSLVTTIMEQGGSQRAGIAA